MHELSTWNLLKNIMRKISKNGPGKSKLHKLKLNLLQITNKWRKMTFRNPFFWKVWQGSKARQSSWGCLKSGKMPNFVRSFEYFGHQRCWLYHKEANWQFQHLKSITYALTDQLSNYVLQQSQVRNSSNTLKQYR